jgi:RimJ/RimL family protein N-acetyltransferase
MDLFIEKIDHEDAGMRERLYNFLAPHEAYCLFITGNLKRALPDSHIYIARQGKDWIGVAGYYGIPRSIVLFSLHSETSRALTRYIAKCHSVITAICAVAHVAEPACEELSRMGYKLTGNPRCVFMRLEEQPPTQPFEEFVRPIMPSDYDVIARLLRNIPGLSQASPVTKDELIMLRINPSCRVLEINRTAVSTASTNGMGISGFQIIGVATHPEHRNKGYARAVCAALIKEMWAVGARYCILFTDIENIAAQTCYKKLGFRADGEYWVARFDH